MSVFAIIRPPRDPLLKRYTKKHTLLRKNASMKKKIIDVFEDGVDPKYSAMAWVRMKSIQMTI